MTPITKKKLKDILIRAAKTFVQAFVGAFSVETVLADIGNKKIIESLLISAIAAGISAVMNAAIQTWNKEE